MYLVGAWNLGRVCRWPEIEKCVAGLSVCVVKLVTFFFLSFVCFVFNMGTNLSVLLGERSRSWCGFCCSKYEKEFAERFIFFFFLREFMGRRPFSLFWVASYAKRGRKWVWGNPFLWEQLWTMFCCGLWSSSTEGSGDNIVGHVDVKAFGH